MLKKLELLGLAICALYVHHTDLLANGKANGISDVDSAQVEWIRTIQAGHSSSVDGINAVSTDAQGNVYVTGKSESADGMCDILTIKYNSLGVKLWSARYDGPAHGVDLPMLLVTSPDGSVYVLGQSQGTDTVGSYDCVTLKYSPDGQQVWANRYANTPWNVVPHALTIDSNGNVYVLTSIKSWDYFGNNNPTAIIKYSGSGAEEWVRIEEGPVNGFGESPCLAVDNAGTVFVGGTSPDSIGGKYKLTVASYSTVGDPVWRLRYNVADTTYALTSDIAIDDSGNVMVTGQYGYRDDGWYYNSYSNLLTLKCSPSGAVLWARYLPQELNTPSHVSRIVRTDFEHNIYVVGLSNDYGYGSEFGDSVFAIKYTMDGSEVWRNNYGIGSTVGLSTALGTTSGGLLISIISQLGQSEDSVHVLCIDPSGVGTHVVLGSTGMRDRPIKNYIAVGPNDALYVGSTVGEHNQTEFSLTKYDFAGTPVWNVREDGPGSPSDGSIYAMRLDAQGNIYVAGICRNVNSGFDFMTAKLNSLGVVEWVRTYDGPAHKNDFCHYLELDGQGNVFVAGTSTGSTTNKDYTLIKYSNDGTEQWAQTFDGGGYDFVSDLFVDTRGNSFVAGSAGLEVYSPDGDNIWNTANPTHAVAVDFSGTIFASENGGIVKYDSTGGHLLIPITDCLFANIVLGDSGFIFTSANCFYFGASAGVSKYAANGDLAWSATGGFNLSLDHFDDLYAYTTSLFKFDGETGAPEWTAPGGQAGGRSAFTVDSLGNAYAADGYYIDGSGFHARKYNSAGSRQWDIRLNQLDWTGANPYVLAADADGNLYVACDAQRGDHSSAPTIIKISPFTVGVEEGTGKVPVEFGLSQNYPNPFNPSTEIGFRIVDFGLATLKVFDVLGREVSTLVNEKLEPGTYQRTFDGSNLSSGVYFYRLQAGEFAETRKLLLLK